MCPTTATVLWNVLVTVGRQVIFATDVAPVPILWHVGHRQHGVRQRCRDHLWEVFPVGWFDDAALTTVVGGSDGEGGNGGEDDGEQEERG